MNNVATADNYRDAICQADAILSFEGFSPSPDRVAIDSAILAGRVSSGQVLTEMRQYLAEHKSLKDFASSRSWI